MPRPYSLCLCLLFATTSAQEVSEDEHLPLLVTHKFKQTGPTEVTPLAVSAYLSYLLVQGWAPPVAPDGPNWRFQASPRDSSLITTVPISLQTHVTLSRTGTSVPLTVTGFESPQAKLIFLRYTASFPSYAEFQQALPAGLYKIATERTATPKTIAWRQVVHADAPSPIRVTNFAALQRWDGSPLTINWEVIPVLANNSYYTFEIRRANGNPAVLASLDPAKWVEWLKVRANGATATGIEAQPGEVLTGKLRYLSQFQTDDLGNPTASEVEVWLEFPIRRLAPPPVIATAPTAQTLNAGSPLSLAVAASGFEVSYQWQRNGASIPGATGATFSIPAVSATDAADYAVTVSNPFGSVSSAPAKVTVVTPIAIAPPAIAVPPRESAVLHGAAAVFAVEASGQALSYQWKRNGEAIPGATQPTLTIATTRLADAASYSVLVTNSAGSTESAPARLTVASVPRLSNLSIRTRVGGEAGDLTVGFTVGGGTAGSKSVLLRGAGPSLAAFGVNEAAPAVQLVLARAGETIASNQGWSGTPALIAASAAVGAFPFSDPTSSDAALVTSVAPAGYTARMAAPGAGGIALAEVYDTTADSAFVVFSPRLINLSALARVGAGGDVLIAGFNLTGSTGRQRLLVRAIGPSLAAFGVGDPLADPRLEVFPGGSALAVAGNDNWDTPGNGTAVATVAARVGAFPLTPGSRDAAVVLELNPGSYTVQVNGNAGAAGPALIEIYADATP